MIRFLTVPGIGNSGEHHWQTAWERSLPSFQRVIQDDWDQPQLGDWIDRLENAVRESGPETVVVAHSLGCLLVAHWAAGTSRSLRGALLVAPPDPQATVFPAEAASFVDAPHQRLRFRSTVVASSDDPYATLDYSRACARAWGSQLVDIGPAGHINGASGLGLWPKGQQILQRLIADS